MELSKIEKLLEKYLNADTNLQEEAALKDYFLSGNVASHLQEYASMFHYFTISKAEKSSREIQLKPKKKPWKWLSLAASVALLFSAYMGNNYIKEQKMKAQYAQVTNALKIISTNLNKGSQAVVSLNTYEDTVSKIFKTK